MGLINCLRTIKSLKFYHYESEIIFIEEVHMEPTRRFCRFYLVFWNDKQQIDNFFTCNDFDMKKLPDVNFSLVRSMLWSSLYKWWFSMSLNTAAFRLCPWHLRLHLYSLTSLTPPHIHSRKKSSRHFVSLNKI